MTQYLGTDAGFYYFESGATTWKTFPLAVPLREGRLAYRINQHVAESLDLSQRQTLNVASTVSTGVYEYVGTIRYSDTQTDLIAFLKHAALLSGSTSYPIRYTTDLTTGTTGGARGNGMDLWLVDPMVPFDTVLDRQRGDWGDLEITIRLRPMTQSQDFTTSAGVTWFR